MDATYLPVKYADLERFCADWALETTHERHLKRAASSMEELQAFYAAIAPRAGEIIDYLNTFPLDALPAPERRLLNLCLALADVSLVVEKYKVPLLPDAPYSTKFRTDTSALG